MIELLINPIAELLGKAIPDADTRAKLSHEIATLAENHAQAIALAQVKTNTVEAAHKSLFVAGWRPFIGWACGVALANNFILAPYITAFTDTVVPTLDMGEMMPVLAGMLGLGAYRSYEKVKGVAREK